MNFQLRSLFRDPFCHFISWDPLLSFGEKKIFFIIGGNASKAGIIDALSDLRPKYLLVDEIEHLKSEYQTMLLSLMETGILTQTMHKKVRQIYLKTWVTWLKYRMRWKRRVRMNNIIAITLSTISMRHCYYRLILRLQHDTYYWKPVADLIPLW